MIFKLYYPVKIKQITQGFGKENTAPDLLPTYQAMGLQGHNGWDFKAYHGQAVYAAHDGTCFPEIDASGGYGVVLISNDKFDYKDTQCFMKSIFWHMVKDVFAVKTGQKVKAGDLIGYADNTGTSTGDHLHFGLKPIVLGDNISVQDATDFGVGSYVNVEKNNGYLGSIDPTPYWNGLYAQDIPILNQAIEIGIQSVKIAQNNPSNYLIEFLGKVADFLRSLFAK